MKQAAKPLSMLFLALSSSLLCQSVVEKSSSKITVPQAMRLCINSGCNNLRWANDHYDGTIDGQTAVAARYWVIAWSANHVELYGRTVLAITNGYPAEGKFTGTIAANGFNIENAQDQWNIGPSKGSMPFTLNWSNKASVSTILRKPTLATIPPDSGAICKSHEIHSAMQSIVDQEATDPAGAALGLLSCGALGLCGDAAHPGSVTASILASRPATDSVGFTTNDPGSFLCQGLFAHGDIHVEAGDNGDAVADMTAEVANKYAQSHPSFEENFKVRPIEPGQFELILLQLPSGFKLSRQYSTKFSYSDPATSLQKNTR